MAKAALQFYGPLDRDPDSGYFREGLERFIETRGPALETHWETLRLVAEG